MSATKQPVVLYFVNGPVATHEDIQRGESLVGAQVKYRNAYMVLNDDCVEECDGVEGAVPESYAGKPSGREAIEAYADKVRAARAASGDQEAPALKGKPGRKRKDISEADPAAKGDESDEG